MRKRILNPLVFILSLYIGELGLEPFRANAGTISFSRAERLVTLPWLDGSNHGVPRTGPEWLIVDNHGRYYLDSNLDFDVYGPEGGHLRRIEPLDKSRNFYGFITMEPMADDSIVLLARLETPQEQWGKDNFQEHTKPGARLIVLSAEGRVKLDKEEVDPGQPHSSYYVEKGVVYSIHDDGTYQTLESLDPKEPGNSHFGDFAAVAFNAERWWDHVKKLPIFHSGSKAYHDTKGQPHEIEGATSTLLGHTLVEGVGPVADRGGKIYYQVVCDKNQDFVNSIFVENTPKRDYGFVELIRSDEDLDMTHGHTLFVNRKGDVFEGVGKKEGYRIYEWKISR